MPSNVQIKTKADEIRNRIDYHDVQKQIAWQDLRTLQRQCTHTGESTFVPDPSGNNDSYHICELCGGTF